MEALTEIQRRTGHPPRQGHCRLLGWLPSQFLSARAEAERAFQFAERLGSVRDGRNALVGWAVLFEG